MLVEARRRKANRSAHARRNSGDRRRVRVAQRLEHRLNQTIRNAGARSSRSRQCAAGSVRDPLRELARRFARAAPRRPAFVRQATGRPRARRGRARERRQPIARRSRPRSRSAVRRVKELVRDEIRMRVAPPLGVVAAEQGVLRHVHEAPRGRCRPARRECATALSRRALCERRRRGWRSPHPFPRECRPARRRSSLDRRPARR